MAEMITENEAKLKVETIKPLQESGAFCVCPRCGGAMRKMRLKIRCHGMWTFGYVQIVA